MLTGDTTMGSPVFNCKKCGNFKQGFLRIVPEKPSNICPTCGAYLQKKVCECCDKN